MRRVFQTGNLKIQHKNRQKLEDMKQELKMAH